MCAENTCSNNEFCIKVNKAKEHDFAKNLWNTHFSFQNNFKIYSWMKNHSTFSTNKHIEKLSRKQMFKRREKLWKMPSGNFGV